MAVSQPADRTDARTQVLRAIEGNELRVIDSVISVVHPLASRGDPVATDQLIKLLDLRLRYKRQRSAEESW